MDDAGSGILHDELPTERMYRSGGPMHLVQLWVNLPAARKMTPPRYQSIAGNELTLVTSADGAALLRIIAGNIGSFFGPGSTHTPITYAHLTITPDAEVRVPWNPAFTTMAYVLRGRGYGGPDNRPLEDHQLAVFGPGDYVTLRAAGAQSGDASAMDVLLLGGLPIREPIAHYGPFVMNTSEEIVQTIEDFQRGKLGVIPADQIGPRRFS